jgi:orotidine-5'-phosphate decarboxylase
MNPAEPATVSPLTAPEDRLAVALDFPTGAEALAMVDRLDGACRWYKVGMELYYRAGNQLLEILQKRGFKVFLDLKLHDIPNTVAGAVRTVAQTGVSLLTVHAGGGGAMLQAAAEAARTPGAPRLLAVTVLTSMDDGQLASVGVSGGSAEQVLRLARLAQASGITGMVCSAEEVATLRVDFGTEVLLVTPGIRAAGEDEGDQKRIATAGRAIALGSSMLVVGRPITRAADPEAAARRILDEIRKAAC